MTKWNEIVMVQVSYNVFPMPSLCSLVSALGGALIKHLLTSPVPDPQAISRQYWDQHPHLSFASSSTNRMLVTGHLVSCTLWKTLTYLIFSVLLVATFSLSLNTQITDQDFLDTDLHHRSPLCCHTHHHSGLHHSSSPSACPPATVSCGSLENKVGIIPLTLHSKELTWSFTSPEMFDLLVLCHTSKIQSVHSDQKREWCHIEDVDTWVKKFVW